MPKSKPTKTNLKTYEIEVILSECTNGKRHKIIWRDSLGIFLSKEEAIKDVELITLPDDYTVI